MNRQSKSSLQRFCRGIVVVVLLAMTCGSAHAQQTSMSAWDAADFRIWGYIPDWDASEVGSIAANGLYSHVSDVLFFDAARTDSTGTITNVYPTTTATLRQQAAQYGFKLHLSMYGKSNVDATWTSIINSDTYSQNFVDGIKKLLTNNTAGTSDDMAGFNFDWERPSSADLWGKYTQLAKKLGDAIHPLGMEVSVCDFGSTDFRWDDTNMFDAKVYDQLFMMSYHLSKSLTSTFATQKTTLTGQGAAKAFSMDQIAVGVGTYGTDGPSVTLDAIVNANPNLAYDALSYTGTLTPIGSTTPVSDTWTIESRKQVREKTQFALDNNMPGMFTWTLSYDSPTNLGLHRVMHHYAMVKRDIPDLNLDGKVDVRDGYALADNMGSMLTNTGTTTAAQLDAFYMGGNWEKGDHDGNGMVNQAEVDWLVGRWTALGLNIAPDRLPFSGTFDNFPSSLGITGRWKAGRNAQGKLVETGNFKQELSNYLLWSSRGAGGRLHSNSFVTIRNQNAVEVAAGLNSAVRTMQADITTNFDLSQNQDTYVKFLVRENTAPLTAAQLASANRTLSLDFLNSSGASQFDIAFRGLQHQFAIDSVADTTGQDVSANGFASDTTYMLIAKISGNGAGANTMRASLFAVGDTIGNFTDPSFPWMLTAQSSASFNPLITDIQFTSNAGANYTVSNLWIGSAAVMLPTGGSGSTLPAVPEPAGFFSLFAVAIFTAAVSRSRPLNRCSSGQNC
jgi:hypothetical protein